jgi:PHD/YefM family antitoxin component YafN of YafNO toxin-antitoxin module
MSDTCSVDDARVILPDLIEQVRALSRPVVLTAEDEEPVAVLVPAEWLDRLPAAAEVLRTSS